MKLLRDHPMATIVVAQLLGTSLWFSPNSAAESLVRAWDLSPAELGRIFSATQIGFIVGTLVLATSGLADRFPASRICALACVLGAGFNAAFALAASGVGDAIGLRFAVGVCLAGIYPLGMKMVIGWTRGNTGSALGLLIAMLTLGSALPHAVRAVGVGLSWQGVVLTSSLLSMLGGAMVGLLGDGPHLAPAGRRPVRWGAALQAFADPRFRASAFGYFGHMWELYAFWTVSPFLIADVLREAGIAAEVLPRATSALAFVVMGIGAVGSVAAGRMSHTLGNARAAAIALATSGLICLLYPWLRSGGTAVSLIALLVWGIAVVADSAQFSAISARVCPPDRVGGALAIQNSIGFAITVVSITMATAIIGDQGSRIAWYLLPGPVIGLLFFRRLLAPDAERRHVGTG